MHYLLATVELPIVSQILEATQEKPFLGLRLRDVERLREAARETASSI
jgi:hypothetical protein